MSLSGKRIMWVVAMGVLLCGSGISSAQESGSAPQDPVSNEMAAMPATNAEPAAMNAETTQAPSSAPEASASKEAMAPQWIWGEVVSADPANKQVQIKHLDYETYEEVTKVIQADSGTLFENVSGIGDLKPGDSVTVDFKMKDGAQVAELIVVDKNRVATDASATAAPPAPAAAPEEAAVSAPPPQEPAVPAMLQPDTALQPDTTLQPDAAPDQAQSSQEPEAMPAPGAKKGSIPMGRI